MRRNRLRRLAGAAPILALLAVPAQAQRRGPLVRVSGRSPFAACSADLPALQPGRNFPHSEVEPQLAVNPRNPANLVAFYQQDRWSDGGARGLVASVSYDGGSSWQQVVVPGLSACSGGGYQRASDPWISFSPTGELHAVALAFNPPAPGASSEGPNALLATRSSDGGTTWAEPIAIAAESGGGLHDKDAIFADPADPSGSLVYVVWDRYTARGSRAYLARSLDGGRSWEPPRMIYDPGLDGFTVGHQIAVLRDGTLLNVYTDWVPQRDAAGELRFQVFLGVMRSRDRGVNWSAPSRVLPIEVGGIRLPDLPREAVRAGDDLPDVAVDRASDRVYAVWQQGPRGFALDNVVFSQSRDGGFNWTPPAALRAPFPGDPQAFTPSVQVASDGLLGVSFYDFRRNDARPGDLTDHWLIQCLPHPPGACADPQSWGGEVRLTNGPFDLRRAPNAHGFFLGDYVGLESDGLDFLALFSQTEADDPASVFFRRVEP